MDKSIAFILSLSICIPLITGIIRYGQLPVSYTPLILMLITGFLQEIVSYFFFYNTTNAIPSNIFTLLEFPLLAWQFKKWKNILKNDWMFISLVCFMALLWTAENIVFGRITQFSYFYPIFYSVAIILFAVNQMNWLIVNEKNNIASNPVFLICIALIVFFSYRVLTEIFYYYAPDKNDKNNIFAILSYVNVGYNIILAVAILCIPPKRTFIRLSQ